jgi:acyl carrier protein
MHDSGALRQEIKRLLVENLMLQTSPEGLPDAAPLFGPGGPGLDSVDALQIVVALDKTYGLKVPDPETAKTILASVESIAKAVQVHLSTRASTPEGFPASRLT